MLNLKVYQQKSDYFCFILDNIICELLSEISSKILELV